MCPSCRCAFQQLKKKRNVTGMTFYQFYNFALDVALTEDLYVYLSMFTSHYGGDHTIVQCHFLYWIIWSGLYKKIRHKKIFILNKTGPTAMLPTSKCIVIKSFYIKYVQLICIMFISDSLLSYYSDKNIFLRKVNCD